MKKLDHILVVDVESTCWQGAPPKGQTSDIIEIGVTLLDVRTLERRDKRSIMVKPARSDVSPFCTSLTTITPADVAKGMPFEKACAILQRELGARDRLWASWGDYDRKQFQRNCDDLGVPYPFGPGHLNAKTLMAVALGLSQELGMAEALTRFGLPLEGTHHRGGDDAWNIAAILGALLARMR